MTDTNLSPLSAAEVTEIAGIEKLMSEDRGRAYWKDESKQQRYYELVQKREAGSASLPATAAPDGGSDRTPAARAPDDLADGRERHVPGQGEEGRGGDRAPAVPPEQVAADFGVDRLAAEVATNVAAELETGFGHGAGELNSVVLGLPDSLRAGMIREIGSPYMKRTPNASYQEIEQFGKTSAGKILVAKWGEDSGRRLALLLARTERFESGLSAPDFKQWQFFWHRSLTAEQRASIADRLTQ